MKSSRGDHEISATEGDVTESGEALWKGGMLLGGLRIELLGAVERSEFLVSHALIEKRERVVGVEQACVLEHDEGLGPELVGGEDQAEARLDEGVGRGFGDGLDVLFEVAPELRFHSIQIGGYRNGLER